jgi:hypothetical protein
MMIAVVIGVVGSLTVRIVPAAPFYGSGLLAIPLHPIHPEDALWHVVYQ